MYDSAAAYIADNSTGVLISP